MVKCRVELLPEGAILQTARQNRWLYFTELVDRMGIEPIGVSLQGSLVPQYAAHCVWSSWSELNRRILLCRQTHEPLCYRNILESLTGVEPALSYLRSRSPRPLDDNDIFGGPYG